MIPSNPKPRISAILAARKALDRRGAAAIIREDLVAGAPSGDEWRAVSDLASQLGEYGLALEAARRYTATAPRDMDRVFFSAMILSRMGRHDDAVRQLDILPPEDQGHPAVLHFRAMTATRQGDFAGAEALIRRAIAVSPAPVQWLALSVAKKFTLGDPDFAQMEAVLPRVGRAPAEVRAQLFYALGKACDDVRDYAKASWAYAQGAILMRQAGGVPDGKRWNDFITRLIAGYNRENLESLKPSGADGSRMIFVTGFPRSGTTLVEQILASHSKVSDGAELNLLPIALMPVGEPGFNSAAVYKPAEPIRQSAVSGDFTFEDAIVYQNRTSSSDPWGDIGRDYLHMVTERFGDNGLVVDKSLNIGSFMGLLMHSLPKAKVLWLRRRPEDNALSIYRLYSQLGTLPWTYSPSDIADFFRAEDRLYVHWSKMYPDRIMTVPYEELVSNPQDWIRQIMAFTGLPEEPQVFEPHKSTRTVTTASMAQVRSPISTARIGASEAYKAFTEEFRKAYYG